MNEYVYHLCVSSLVYLQSFLSNTDFTCYLLRERAAVDASQLGELEGILTEARSLEANLKEKKEHLRRSLALISDKLQG